MMTRKRYNPARAAAAELASLARSYVADSIAPAADKKLLRLAAESLPISVESLIDAIEKAYPGDSRAGSMARAGAMNHLTNALGAASAIGNSHYDSSASKTVINHLKGKAARDAKIPIKSQLVRDINNHKWKFRLAKGEPCAGKVAKALKYDVTQRGYSLSSIRRAIETVLETSPK
jgi:hypothetical protein